MLFDKHLSVKTPGNETSILTRLSTKKSLLQKTSVDKPIIKKQKKQLLLTKCPSAKSPSAERASQFIFFDGIH